MATIKYKENGEWVELSIGDGTGVTEQKVEEMIAASIGDINTILDNINGEAK